jgi:3-deoxy-D-manno-octulosonate 8-phosphate phosphatase (KDO 8-P phosphatase)
MLYQKLKKIRAVLFDVDGVLTAGHIIHSNAGDELKHFDVQDGFGITMLRLAGFKTGIITGRDVPLVAARAKELKLDFLSMGHFSKLEPFQEALIALDMEADEVAYMGDDILDLPILSRVGFAVAPANCRPELKAYVDLVTRARGGQGAVREFSDFLLRNNGKYDELFAKLANLPQ